MFDHGLQIVHLTDGRLEQVVLALTDWIVRALTS